MSIEKIRKDRKQRAISGVFWALSNPVRLTMVQEILARGEVNNTYFVESMGMQKANASVHIKHLYNSGILKIRQEGVRKWISINGDTTHVIEAIAAASSIAGCKA